VISFRRKAYRFLYPEETATADALGDLRRYHLVPAFVPLSDALEHVPEKIGRLFWIILARRASSSMRTRITAFFSGVRAKQEISAVVF
jgi:hypothetical protein